MYCHCQCISHIRAANIAHVMSLPMPLVGAAFLSIRHCFICISLGGCPVPDIQQAPCCLICVSGHCMLCRWELASNCDTTLCQSPVLASDVQKLLSHLTCASGACNTAVRKANTPQNSFSFRKLKSAEGTPVCGLARLAGPEVNTSKFCPRQGWASLGTSPAALLASGQVKAKAAVTTNPQSSLSGKAFTTVVSPRQPQRLNIAGASEVCKTQT